MKQFVSTLLLLLSLAVAEAQTLVQGGIIDTQSKPVAYATVAILRDAKPVTATASDQQGKFHLTIKEAGDYTLSITSVGYNSYTAPLQAKGQPIQLEPITLAEGVEVDAVVLTVQKPIVTADAEKLNYSVEDDPEAQSSTLEEIIRKVPQLSIDADGKVLMNGQSDYKILVNGHPSNAISRNFSEVIKSMPANTIKRIEVITNPSMKYDAEGMGGVLNIITTKARFDGYNGSINSGWQFNESGSWMTDNSATLAIQTGKLTLSGSFYQFFANGLDRTLGEMNAHTENRTPEAPYQTMNSNGRYGMRASSVYGNLQASYQIDTMNLLTAEFSVYDGYSLTRTRSEVEQLDAADEALLRYNNLAENRPEWRGYDFGMSYERRMGKEGHTLTLSDNVSIMPTTGSPTSELITEQIGSVGYRRLTGDTRSNHLSNTFQADYTNPISGKHTIEAGIKHLFDQSENSSFNRYDDYERMGEAELQKQILGLYGGYAYNTLGFSTRVGVRLESAWYKLEEAEEGQRNRYTSNLINVIPYASVTLMPAMGQMWALSYTQRLRRPGVEAMSPYIKESTTQRTYGNPDLETGVSHSINLRYSYMANKWTIALGLTTNLSSNLAAQYSFIDDEGFINTTYENRGRMQFYIGDAALSWRPSTNFNLSGSLRGGWGRYRLPGQGIEVEGWCFSQSFNMMIGLWKGGRLTLSEYCAKPEHSMNAYWDEPFCFVSARLGQKFFNEKLELSVTAQNPFGREIEVTQITDTPSYLQANTSTMRVRSLRVALSWRFGKQGITVKRANRKSDTHTDQMQSDKSASANTGVMGGMR